MAHVQSPLMVQAQTFLDDYVSKIPAHSTIGIALDVINSLSLQEKKQVQYRVPGEKDLKVKQYDCIASVYSAAGWDWSGRAIAISALRCVVTYLALQALAFVSLYVNGAAGVGKIVLGFTISSINYEKGQDYVEEGFFQLMTGIYDYAVGQFGLICSIFALLEGGSPETVLDIHARVFQTYKGAIEHKKDDDDEEENYCLLQRLADTAQEMVLPTSGGDYVKNVVASWDGRSPQRLRRQQQMFQKGDQ